MLILPIVIAIFLHCVIGKVNKFVCVLNVKLFAGCPDVAFLVPPGDLPIPQNPHSNVKFTRFVQKRS